MIYRLTCTFDRRLLSDHRRRRRCRRLPAVHIKQ